LDFTVKYYYNVHYSASLEQKEWQKFSLNKALARYIVHGCMYMYLALGNDKLSLFDRNHT